MEVMADTNYRPLNPNVYGLPPLQAEQERVSWDTGAILLQSIYGYG